MGGTRAGGLKAAAKNRAYYGDGTNGKEDYYVTLGRKGGKAGRTGGFASTVVGEDGLSGKQRASIAGKVGGSTSRRKPRTITYEDLTDTKSVSLIGRLLRRSQA